MSTAFRPRRPAPSAVTAPTAVHVTQTVSLSKTEVQSALDAFLEAADTGAALATNGADPAASVAAAYLSQLKRVQREMRGLPPMMPEVSELSGGKKIKFDDGDINMDADEGQAVEAAPAGVPLYANGKINKEERKRLKKERRKAEKNKGDVEEED